VAAFGGLSKFDQFKELKAGAEVAVATPGRMMDLIRMKACNTLRVTYLVLDEADRMFDMGFEQQVIAAHQGHSGGTQWSQCIRRLLLAVGSHGWEV
jgi:superfamily II DNA/RNA helicase